jgi:hypothetical protein
MEECLEKTQGRFSASIMAKNRLRASGCGDARVLKTERGGCRRTGAQDQPCGRLEWYRQRKLDCKEETVAGYFGN